MESEFNIYKKMYYRLFNRVTDAMESETKEISDNILRRAQMEAEDMYLFYEESINEKTAEN